ncbi:MAG: hypothetical protein INR68_13270 [Methylobacterium mesophilicum]|nr:hypothetical protein [Methylobacterium mesophilicum]
MNIGSIAQLFSAPSAPPRAATSETITAKPEATPARISNAAAPTPKNDAPASPQAPAPSQASTPALVPAKAQPAIAAAIMAGPTQPKDVQPDPQSAAATVAATRISGNGTTNAAGSTSKQPTSGTAATPSTSPTVSQSAKSVPAFTVSAAPEKAESSETDTRKLAEQVRRQAEQFQLMSRITSSDAAAGLLLMNPGAESAGTDEKSALKAYEDTSSGPKTKAVA